MPYLPVGHPWQYSIIHYLPKNLIHFAQEPLSLLIISGNRVGTTPLICNAWRVNEDRKNVENLRISVALFIIWAA